MWVKGKRWGARQGFAPTRLHLERTMEGTWEPSEVPGTWYLAPAALLIIVSMTFSVHLSANHGQYLGQAVPTQYCLQHEERYSYVKHQAREQRLPQLRPFDPITG